MFKIEWYHRSAFILSFLLWVAPVFYTGMFGRDVPSAPVYCQDLWRVSCLFTRRVGGWNNYYLVFKRKGSDTWEEIPPEELSTFYPFGYRTKIQRFMSKSGANAGKRDLKRSIAAFAYKRYSELHSDVDTIELIGLAVVARRTGEQLAAEVGRWRQAPYADLAQLKQKPRFTARFRVNSKHFQELVRSL